MNAAGSRGSLPFDAEVLAGYRPYLRTLAEIELRGRFVRGFDASDVAQEALLRAFRGAGRLRARSGPELLAWLRKALAGALRDKLRRERRLKRDPRRELSLEASLARSSQRFGRLLEGKASSPSGHAVRQENRLLLARALERLPDAQREAVVLRHIEELPLEEIAERMGRTTYAVSGLLRRGLRRLREELEGLFDEGSA